MNEKEMKVDEERDQGPPEDEFAPRHTKAEVHAVKEPPNAGDCSATDVDGSYQTSQS